MDRFTSQSDAAASQKHRHKTTPSACKSFNPPKYLTIYTKPPSSWPKAIPYLPQCCLSTSLSKEQLEAIRSATVTPPSTTITVPNPVVFSPTSNPLITIRPITNPEHPANGQSGLFASRNLPSGSHITDYTGHLHACPDPQGDCSSSDYDLAFLDRDAGLAIDGSKMGNEGRFVNDYHGILDQDRFIGPDPTSKLERDLLPEHGPRGATSRGGKENSKSQSTKTRLPAKKDALATKPRSHAKGKVGPNAVFEEYFVKTRGKAGKEVWEARMGIWVSPSLVSGIAKGDEICVSYGRGYWRARAREVLEGEFAHDPLDTEGEGADDTGAI